MTIAPTTHFRLGYQPVLDGLRGICVLAVLAYHIDLLDLGGQHLSGGFLGVDGFFVLSGFLITTLLLQEWQRTGSINFKNFYMRRALRLLPALCGLLIACALYALVFATRAEAADIWQSIVPVLFYYVNWAAGLNIQPFLFFGHAWSLSLEEQFYLLWPLLLFLMLRFVVNRGRILTLVSLGIVASALLRLVLWQNAVTFLRLYMALDTRADALLVGCLIGLLADANQLPRSTKSQFLTKLGAVLATILLVVLARNAFVPADYLYRGMFLGVAQAVGIIIIMLLNSPIRLYQHVLEFAPLVWIGRISYGLYLWHWPVFLILGPSHLQVSRSVMILLQVGATFMAATLSYLFIEQPFLKLKSRFSSDANHAESPSTHATIPSSLPERP